MGELGQHKPETSKYQILTMYCALYDRPTTTTTAAAATVAANAACCMTS